MKMALFAMADLHLSLGCDKPMDVFGGQWVDYVKKLDEYWNYMVDPDDTVVVPGDISWAMKLEEGEPDFKHINELNGKKIFIRGNHDYWWNTPSKLRKFFSEKKFDSISVLQNEAVFAEGFVICGSRGWLCENKMSEEDIKILNREAERMQLALKDAKRLRDEKEAETGIAPEILVFMHYPLTQLQVVRSNPIVEVIKNYDVSRVFYGHLHCYPESRLVKNVSGLEHILISSDHLRFTPYRISQ
ncbi:MAG: serine/threonine protein phosphatase [Ruminococcaceae bacterium]|nr:serine/threonine protein phosphatase [Oscillospiraceae bacterium]